MGLSRENMAWAAQAMRDGRSLSYIASVLEITEKNARRAAHKGREQDNHADPSLRKVFKARLDEPAVSKSEMRKILLRRRFAKHWPMIWFLRAQGMCGRTLRQIYGSDVLIWSVGGGIDGEI